jgi:hypothetical protein
MQKRLLGLVLAVLLLAAVSTASATTFGVPDGDAHPYVGLIIFDDAEGPAWRCTGTLISPTVVLTAGHCAEGAVAARIWFDADVDANPEYPFGGSTSVEGTPYYHPLYGGFPQTYDVGVVVLDEPVTDRGYGALPAEGLLETMVRKPASERRFTVVGYGLQGYIKPFYSADRVRYRGDVTLIELNSTFAGGHSAKFTNNPGLGNGSGGSCFGDSGGPVFVANSNVVAAVVSWGITPCIGVDYQFRMDTPFALEFVQQFLGN